MKHLTTDELHAGLDHIRDAPKDHGTLRLIVRRPAINAREVLEEGELSAEKGHVGDTWHVRGSSRSKDGRAHPDMQLNLMGARAVALVAQSPDRCQLAGDQLFRPLRREVTRRAFQPAVEVCRIVPGLLPGTAGVWGAALAFQNQRETA